MSNKIRGLASIELNVIAKELRAEIVSAYFKNFYELKEDCFLITFSKERRETAVYISLTKTVNITEFKEKTEMPTEFALSVRKRLEGSIVMNVEQHASDRILVIEFAGREQRKLVLEMFDKGNLLVVNEDNLIELVYNSRSFKERSLRKGMSYLFPVSRGKASFYSMDQEKIKEIEPRMYERDNEYLDFAMLPMPKYEEETGIKVKKFATLSKLLDEVYLKDRTSQVSEEKTREAEELRSSTEQLRKQIEEMKVKSEEYKKVAHRIFERMDEINELLQHVSKSKARNMEELKGSGNIKVKRIDPKKKTITVELD